MHAGWNVPVEADRAQIRIIGAARRLVSRIPMWDIVD
jgi:hypothetical protein